METKIFKNNLFKNHMILAVTTLLIEIALRIICGTQFLGWALLRIFISVNIVSLFLAIIFSFCNKLWSKILNLLFIGSLSILALAQITFNDSMGTFMSINASSQLGKVTSYIFDYIATASWYFYFVLIPFIGLIIYYIFFDKTISVNIRKPNRKNYLLAGIGLLILNGLFYLTFEIPFMQNKFQVLTNKELFHYPETPNVAVNEFGIIGYTFVDFKTVIIPSDEGFVSGGGNKKEPIVVNDYTRIIDDTPWKKGAESETNKSYINLNNYFMNRDITPKNEMTGIFKDKNLIVVQMESVNNIPLLYPELFPTLNKLYNEGWAWDNNYTPRNSCATGNNEMTAMTSLFTINNNCTANLYKKNVYPEAIFSLFNDREYYTSSYHNYADHYYYRKTIHPNMGSNKYYNAYNLKINVEGSYEEWPSDIDLFTKSAPYYMDNAKFMAYLTTVTSHRPYTVSSTYGDKHLKLFKDLDLSISSRRYLSKIKELDLGLEALLNELTKRDKLDDTVILLFADHYPYGLSNNDVQDFFDYEVTRNYERDRTPFIIYNSTLEPKKFDDYTTIMNILPTVANLFDLNYDPRLYIGTDLFSDDYRSMAVFTDGSWQNEKGFYNSSSSKVEYVDETNIYTDEEIIEINKDINNKIKMSALAIKKDYFNYLDELIKQNTEVIPEINAAG